LFIDGEMVASVAHTNAVSMGNFITIGSGSSTNFNNDAFQGNISELRYTKTSRYTSSFSVEYLPFL
jgi:DNA phosphorothioation-dependent restriction protein DptG